MHCTKMLPQTLVVVVCVGMRFLLGSLFDSSFVLPLRMSCDNIFASSMQAISNAMIKIAECMTISIVI